MKLVKADFPTRWLVKATIAVHIRAEIEFRKWTQQEAAIVCGVKQPRISDLLNGKIDLFSCDSLIEICEKLKLTVAVSVNR